MPGRCPTTSHDAGRCKIGRPADFASALKHLREGDPAQNEHQGCSRNTHTDQKRRTPANGDDDSADYKCRHLGEHIESLYGQKKTVCSKNRIIGRTTAGFCEFQNDQTCRRPDVPTTPGRFHFSCVALFGNSKLTLHRVVRQIHHQKQLYATRITCPVARVCFGAEKPLQCISRHVRVV